MNTAEHRPDVANHWELVDSVPALIHTGRPDGHLDYFNQRWLEFVGLQSEDLEGWRWTATIHADDVTALVASWRDCLESGRPLEIEARVRRADGAYRWMLHQMQPSRDASGQIVRWYGSSVDIDDRRRVEDKIDEEQSEMPQILDLPPQRLAAQLRATLNVIPAHTYIALPSGSVTFVNERSADRMGLPQDHPLRLGIGTGAELDAIFETVHPEDREETRRVWSTCISTGTPGEVSLRIRDAEGRYLWFISRAAPLRAKDGTLLYWIGVHLEIEGLKEAEKKLQEQQLELRQMLDTIHQQERELRGIVDLIPHLIGIAEPDGRLVYGNQVLLDYYGLTNEELQTLASDDLVRRFMHPDDLERYMKVRERGSAGTTPWETEARLWRRDGDYRSLLVRGTPLLDDAGRIVRWYVTATDIDDRKKAEDKVRQQRREMRKIVDAVPHIIVVTTPDGAHVFGNQVMLDYWGPTSPEDMVATREQLLRRYMHPDDAEPYLATWERGIASSTPWETEGRFRGRGGEYRWFLVRAIPLRDDAGQIVNWYVTGTDIDDRKKAEERIRQDERELRTIVDSLPQLLVVANAENRAIYANVAALEFTGLTLEKTVARADVLSEIVHPDDLPTVRDNLRRTAKGTVREAEVRLRRPGGQYRWTLTRSAPLLDAAGRVTGWFATGTDIDDRKRAEQRMHEENLALREEVDKASMFEEIIGTSPALRAVQTSVAQVAPTDSTVLITGETGTGKELVARAIHKRSSRASRAFVSVNCAAIPTTLIASELFGHEKGAFTGALQRRAGRFELADGGTIFLDEVGDLPPDTQLALLRVLQEREFERVGSARPIKVDVRIIAATNRDLTAAIERDTFRTDLFYRLNVFPIEMPALRERVSDIPMLVAYFVDRYARQAGKIIRRVDKQTLDLLKSYRWPGNVRELQNVIERAVIICDSGTLTVDPHWLARETAKPVRPLGDELTARERKMIETALGESRGRVAGPTGAAAKLGLNPSTLDYKIRALRIDKHRFKRP